MRGVIRLSIVCQSRLHVVIFRVVLFFAERRKAVSLLPLCPVPSVIAYYARLLIGQSAMSLFLVIAYYAQGLIEIVDERSGL